jgi:hypothetical protein
MRPNKAETANYRQKNKISAPEMSKISVKSYLTASGSSLKRHGCKITHHSRRSGYIRDDFFE